MKKFFFLLYKFGLKAQGRYGLMMSVLLLTGLINGVPEEHNVLPLIALLLAGVICGAVMGLPRFTPAWLGDPNGVLKGGAVFVLSGLVFILYVLVGMLGVISWGIEEPLSKALAMLACLPTFLFSNILGWSALVYGVSPDKEGAEPPQHPDIPSAVGPTTPEDLRNLRQSRMTR